MSTTFCNVTTYIVTRLGELQYGISIQLTIGIVIVSLYVSNLLNIPTFIKTQFCFYLYNSLGNTKADNYREPFKSLFLFIRL